MITPKHDKVVKETAKKLDRYSSNKGTIYADHISRYETPEIINGHRPDVVLNDFEKPSVVVEVETAGTLDDKALEQLQAIKKPGHKRFLVVPKNDKKTWKRTYKKTR